MAGADAFDQCPERGRMMQLWVRRGHYTHCVQRIVGPVVIFGPFLEFSV